MSLLPISPNVLDDLLGHFVWVLMKQAEEKGFPNDLAVKPDDELWEKEDGVKTVLEYLKQNRFLSSYSFDMDKTTPIILLNSITLQSVDYDRFNELYQQQLSKISWSLRQPNEMRSFYQDIWFANNVLNYQTASIELSGYQAKLCNLLFDKIELNQGIKDIDVIEFLGADSLFDLKDLIKVLNKKFKTHFGLDKVVIRQKDGMVYRTL